MLARLGYAGTWIMRNSRRLFPPDGRAYELFDGAVFLLVYAVGAYVITRPMQATVADVPILRFVDETQLGVVAAVMAAVAVVLSYSHDHLWLGYTLAATALGVLAINFGVAWVTGDWARGAGLTAWVFINSFRRLMRDNRDR